MGYSGGSPAHPALPILCRVWECDNRGCGFGKNFETRIKFGRTIAHILSSHNSFGVGDSENGKFHGVKDLDSARDGNNDDF